MMNEIHVLVDFNAGGFNQVDARFSIEIVQARGEYFQRDLKRLNHFLSYGLKEFNRDMTVTISPKLDGKFIETDSKRYVMRDFDNGFEERPFDQERNGYPEVPVKTFGTEGNGRNEMKKAINKLIKQMQKEMLDI